MKLKEVNWTSLLFIVTSHLIVLIALPIYLINFSPSPALWLGAIILFILSGLGTTGGYHRLYAHRAYTPTNKITEGAILSMGTLSIQGSALEWSFDHRRHHAYVDTDEDPYNINKGFWHAHWFWLFKKRQKVILDEVPDLKKNKLVMFQDKHFGLLTTILNVIPFLLFGYITKDYLGSFLIVFALRTVLFHEVTWFINSLAHFYGSKHYIKEISAVDNYILAFFTFGEGYHNYHHAFANDYRNGIRWYHFDPSKWFIWTLSKIGLVKNKRKISKYVIMKRLIKEDTKIMNEDLIKKKPKYVEKIKEKIHQLSESLYKKLEEMKHFKEKKEIFFYKESKKIFKVQKKEWVRLSKQLEH